MHCGLFLRLPGYFAPDSNPILEKSYLLNSKCVRMHTRAATKLRPVTQRKKLGGDSRAIEIICNRRYSVNMFPHIKCTEKDCLYFSLNGNDKCLKHISDRDAYIKTATLELQQEEIIRNCNLSTIELNSIELKDKMIIVANFSNSIFTNIDFTGSNILFSLFEYSTFTNCKFNNTAIKYTNFAGSAFINCSFIDSNIVNSNFNGINAVDSSFNESDLYYSTFTSSELKRVTFIECNLKKTDFYNSNRENVSFKYSNYEEALFSRDW